MQPSQLEGETSAGAQQAKDSEICRPIRAHVCAYEHVHFIKTYDQVSRSYELVHARIDLYEQGHICGQHWFKI